MACHFHTHKISEKRHNNFPACPMKDSRSWFNMSIGTNGSTYLKTLLVCPKTGLGIRRKKKRIAITKGFALHANAIKRLILTKLLNKFHIYD